MKITRVEIRNFRSLKNVQIDIPAGLVLFGMNAQGKSSFLDAIRMILFGACQHTGADGRNSGGLIAHGATEAEVTVVTDNHALNLVIEPKKKAFTVFDLKTGEILADIKDRETFWRAVNIDIDHARIAAMSDMFVTSQDLGDLIAAAFSGVVTEQAVIGNADTHADWLRGFVKNRHRSITDLTAIGDDAYTWRTSVNKDLKQARGELDGIGMRPQAPKDASGKVLVPTDAERVHGAIEKASKTRDGLMCERGVASTAMSEDDRVAAIHEAGDVIAKGEPEIAKREKSVSDAETRKTDLANQLAGPDSALRNEKAKGSGKCPTCGHKLKEPGDKELIAKLESEITELRGNIQEIDKLIRAGNSEIQTTKTNIASARARLAELNAPRQTRPLADIDAEIATLDGRIQRGQGILAALEKLRKYDDLKESIALWETEVEHLNWAVTQFREGALLKLLSRERFAEFETRCDAALKPHGYSFRLDVDGKTVTPMLCRGDHAISVGTCSNGEIALAACSIALAFADTGAPVLLDNLNDLDPVHRRSVLTVLKQHPGTVIAASAWQLSDKPEEREGKLDAIRKSFAPLGVAWVEGGEVK